MSEVIIRRAEKGDIPQILDLIKELASFEHGLNQVTMTEKELLRDGFGDETLFKSIVAISENEIQGVAVYHYAYSTWNGKCLYLEDLIVRRNARTSGIGSELMSELIRIAKKEEARRLSWQVLRWNVDAQDFYKKFGADLDGEWLNGRLNQDQIKAFS